MQFVNLSDQLQEQFLPTEQVHTACHAMTTSNAITFNLTHVECSSKHFGSWPIGKCVFLNMHQDLGDFLWSDTSVHARG